MNDKKSTIKFQNDILRLAIPSIVSNITVPLLGLCDVTIMGHVGGATHIGAIAVGSMIFNVMYWLFGFLRMGTSGLTAQAFGRGEKREGFEEFLHPVGGKRPSAERGSWGAEELREVDHILRQSLLTALTIGLCILLLQVPLQWLTFWLMHPTADVARLCTPYYYICIWGAPAMLGLYALTGWFVGMQDTRTPMFVAIGQNVVNIGTSLFLVLVCGMGVKGVAFGTLIAQWAGFAAAIAFVIFKYGKSVLPTPLVLLRTRSLSCPNYQLSVFNFQFIKLYLDIFLRTLCLVAVNFYFTAAGAAQGAEILAANTLLMQLFTLFSYVMDGFAFAGEALAGRYYGANDRTMLRQTVRRLFGWGITMVIIFTAVYWVGGTPFLRLLTSDGSVVSTAAIYLPWAILIPVAGMAAFVWDGVFIGITASRAMLWACLIAAIVFFTIYLVLSPTLGNHALWIALLTYLLLRGIVQTIYFSRLI